MPGREGEAGAPVTVVSLPAMKKWKRWRRRCSGTRPRQRRLAATPINTGAM